MIKKPKLNIKINVNHRMRKKLIEFVILFIQWLGKVMKTKMMCYLCSITLEFRDDNQKPSDKNQKCWLARAVEHWPIKTVWFPPSPGEQQPPLSSDSDSSIILGVEVGVSNVGLSLEPEGEELAKSWNHRTELTRSAGRWYRTPQPHLLIFCLSTRQPLTLLSIWNSHKC